MSRSTDLPVYTNFFFKMQTNEDLQAVSDAWTEIIWRITRNNVKPGTLSVSQSIVLIPFSQLLPWVMSAHRLIFISQQPGVVKDYDKLKQRLRDKPKEPLTVSQKQLPPPPPLNQPPRLTPTKR